MKIAIIGGGTAGFMAAVHLSKYFPQIQLYHIYDPNIPTIGVGEGTLFDFPVWLKAATTLQESDLVARGSMVRKYGILFENWGNENRTFVHNFYPIGQSYSFHISAEKLVELLDEFVVAERIHKKVTHVGSEGGMANIVFSDQSSLVVDFCLDARGFPRQLDENHVEMTMIPTNAAVMRRGPPVSLTMTRAVARPCGWIFVIPLTTHTTYGYIYNNNISDLEELKADFDLFIQEEGIAQVPGFERQLTFPCFMHRTHFDGSILKLGNAASFLEPLEATAIGFVTRQLRVFSHWPLTDFVQGKYHTKEELGVFDPNNLRIFNQHLSSTFEKIAIFVSWHYANGSRFSTPFWAHARACFDRCFSVGNTLLHRAEFDQAIRTAKSLPHPVRQMDKFGTTMSFETGSPLGKQFGAWTPHSFAEVGCGIGALS